MAALHVFTDIGLTSAARELLIQGISPHELIEQSAGQPVDLEGIDIAFGQVGTREVLASSTLRWLQVSSAGITRYDTPDFLGAAKERGLLLTNSSSVFDEPCAEHAFAFLMAQARDLPASLRPGADWKILRPSYRSPRGQTMVILGYGAIARHLVRMLAPFAMKIVAYRRHPRGDEEVPTVPLPDLPTALGQADHVMNLLPANAESERFFNASRFSQIKPGAIFYNIGRGSTVDQDALVEALRSGHLRAAWLDVTDPEPLPESHPLKQLPNCHITPHTAGGHENEELMLVRHFVENFRRFMDSQPLRDRIL